MPDSKTSLPTMGTLKGVTYYAKTSDGQWYFFNHAGTRVTCPAPTEQPFAATTLKYGCHCDIESMDPGFEPDGCVLDDDTTAGCIYAPKAKADGGKEKCMWWRPYTITTTPLPKQT